MNDELMRDAVFNLRYAMRVLERNANLWHRISMLLKFLSLVGGSAAVASALLNHAIVAMWVGLFFAAVQGADMVLSPAEKAIHSGVWRQRYGDLLASSFSGASADELMRSYHELVASDPISPPQSLRELAYDDAVLEQGLDESACYGGHRLMAVLT